MATNSIIRLAAAAALLLAAAGCVYPFDPGIETADDRLVVEGGIHIGTVSSFSFSRVLPFTADEDYSPSPVNISAYLETDGGLRIEGEREGDNSGNLSFDTASAPADQRYRLHFTEQITGREYESDWIDVSPAPQIDELRYILDSGRHELNVALSMHCQGQSHFRWYYEETWEFHSPLWASHYYDRSKQFSVLGEYQPLMAFLKFEGGENNYYCWRSQRSPSIKIFSTADQVDDRFTDLEFHRVPSSDARLAIVYKLTVYLESMSEYAYRYWRNIEENTENQGSIFSPTPSQIAGNIHCISDPSLEVLGYISASHQAVAEMYYVNKDENFFDGKEIDWRTVEVVDVYDPEEFLYMDLRGYAPYTFDPGEMGGGSPTWKWAPRWCVDCRATGGSKEKPKGWPNNDI